MDIRLTEEFRAALGLFPHQAGAQMLAQETVEWCHDHGARIFYPGHDDFPFDSLRIGRVPGFLSCIGGTPWRNAECISIVGSREPTKASLSWMDTYLPEFINQS